MAFRAVFGIYAADEAPSTPHPLTSYGKRESKPRRAFRQSSAGPTPRPATADSISNRMRSTSPRTAGYAALISTGSMVFVDLARAAVRATCDCSFPIRFRKGSIALRSLMIASTLDDTRRRRRTGSPTFSTGSSMLLIFSSFAQSNSANGSARIMRRPPYWFPNARAKFVGVSGRALGGVPGHLAD